MSPLYLSSDIKIQDLGENKFQSQQRNKERKNDAEL